jgi:hypothetical protein
VTRRFPLARAAAAALLLALVACGDDPEVTPEARYKYGFPGYDVRPRPTEPLVGSGVPPRPADGTPPPVVAPTPVPAARPPSPGPSSSPPASPPSRAPAAPAGAYKVVEVKDGGTIAGFCRIENPPAAPPPVVVDKHQNLGCGNGHATERAQWRASDGALGNCVVYLAAVKSGKDFPAAARAEDRTHLIDQRGCRYLPHVSVARDATQLAIGNGDGAEHNIHGYVGRLRDSLLGDTKFNFASPPGSRNADTEAAFLERPGVYVLKCDIHPWMSGYVHLLPHPYADVTSAADDPAANRLAGRYTLTDVPPGTYDLVCWHEGMVETPVFQGGKINSYTYSEPFVRVESVTVKPGAAETKDFAIPYR